MSLPADMTMVDLAGADLTTIPPDLTSMPPDMAGCATITCNPGSQCIAGTCQPCGYLGGPCCFGPTAPPPNHPNASGGGTTGTCTMTNNVCDGTNCVSCGGDGELCCTLQTPCNGVDVCSMGVCIAPDMAQQPPPDMSMTTSFDMSMGTTGGPDLL